MSNAPNDPIEAALQGDPRALEHLILSVQDRIYNLALRVLWHPEDARDATQEILIRMVTHLGQFERRCAFSTWAYRVACNYLLTSRKRRAEMEEVTFEIFARSLASGSEVAPGVPEPEQALLEEEVKVGCTHAMLLCLDRDSRLAYILGEIVALSSDEAARVLEISPASYRKRLSRARKRMETFLTRQCGLASPSATCRCAQRIGVAMARGRIDREHLLFAGRKAIVPESLDVVAATTELHAIDAAAQVYRNHPMYATPNAVIESLRALLKTQHLKTLE